MRPVTTPCSIPPSRRYSAITGPTRLSSSGPLRSMTEDRVPEALRRRLRPSLLEKIPDALTGREFADLRSRAKGLLEGGKAAIRVILEYASPQQAERFSQRAARIDAVDPGQLRLVEQAAVQAKGTTHAEDRPARAPSSSPPRRQSIVNEQSSRQLARGGDSQNPQGYQRGRSRRRFEGELRVPHAARSPGAAVGQGGQDPGRPRPGSGARTRSGPDRDGQHRNSGPPRSRLGRSRWNH